MKHTRTLRTAGWLAVAALLSAALIAPSAALADGPGNNGLDPTGNGTKSNAMVGGTLSGAAGSATMAKNAVMVCSADSVSSVGGSFTLDKTLDSGSTITIYMVPNNGSNATPSGNVTKNEATITFNDANRTSGTVISWSISVTNPFTVSAGGILVVFAVNSDGTTAISSSKTNSLNCTESSTTSSSSSTTSTTASTTSTTASTTSTTASTTSTVSSETTASTTSTVSSETTASTTATSTTATGTVSEQTGANPTPPATDAISSGSSGSSPDGWRIVLFAMAGLLGATLLLTPVAARKR